MRVVDLQKYVGLATESVPVPAVKVTVMLVTETPVAVDAPERSAL